MQQHLAIMQHRQRHRRKGRAEVLRDEVSELLGCYIFEQKVVNLCVKSFTAVRASGV